MLVQIIGSIKMYVTPCSLVKVEELWRNISKAVTDYTVSPLWASHTAHLKFHLIHLKNWCSLLKALYT